MTGRELSNWTCRTASPHLIAGFRAQNNGENLRNAFACRHSSNAFAWFPRPICTRIGPNGQRQSVGSFARAISMSTAAPSNEAS